MDSYWGRIIALAGGDAENANEKGTNADVYRLLPDETERGAGPGGEKPGRRNLFGSSPARKPGAAHMFAIISSACKSPEKARRLEKAFSCRIPDEVYDKMEEELQDSE